MDCRSLTCQGRPGRCARRGAPGRPSSRLLMPIPASAWPTVTRSRNRRPAMKRAEPEIAAPASRPAGDARLARPPADAQRAGGPGVTLVPLRNRRGRRTSAVRHNPAWTIKHNGCKYAVFDLDGKLQVTDARCPHNGGPLAGGIVRDGGVTCPWHSYCFDLRTGECRTSAGYQLRTYPVVSRAGRLFAELPGVARPRAWLRLLRAWWPARKAALD